MASAMATDPTDDMRRMVEAMVKAREDAGRKRAVDFVARELGISQSRVSEYLKNRVSRAWADEWMRAREVYVKFCERQAAQSAHEATLYAARAAALREQLCEPSD